MKANAYRSLVFLPPAGIVLLFLAEKLPQFMNGTYDPGRLTHELLILILLVLWMWGISNVPFVRNRSLIQKLWISASAAPVLWIGLRILEKLSSFTGTPVHQFQISSFRDLISVLVFLAVVFLSLSVFMILKELIYIQQSKHTARDFHLLIISIVLLMVSAAFQGDDPNFQMDSWLPVGDTAVENVLFGIMVFFALANGFRCKWIHYLNKQQKVGVFFFGAIAYALAVVLILRSPKVVQNFSLTAGVFLGVFHFFYILYWGMTLLGILFHLPSAGIIDQRLKEIRSFQALSAAIGSVFDREDLVDKTAELAKNIVDANYSWIELKQRNTFRTAGSCGLTVQDIDRLPGNIKTFIRGQVQETGSVILINDLAKNRNTHDIRTWNKKAGSLLAAPIQLKNRPLGILYAVKTDMFGFLEESRGLFQAVADQMAIALETTKLLRVTVEQEVYREELKMAHDAQMRLLPKVMPRIKGFDLDAFCVTANEIGGDFYDVIEVSPDRLDIVIGDVSGKGASAAFYMAELKGVIQALAPHFTSPRKILMEVNTFLRKNFEANTFATMVYGIFIPSKRKIVLARAGHTPVALMKEGKVVWIETRGLGLGLAPTEVSGSLIREKTFVMNHGETLFLFTDGLIEARDPENQEYGEKRLGDALLPLSGLSAQEILREIHQDMEQFSRGVARHDDVTIFILRVTG